VKDSEIKIKKRLVKKDKKELAAIIFTLHKLITKDLGLKIRYDPVTNEDND
jgi:hypothetical protein